MDRQWKLGEDLYPEDNLLNEITFNELIATVKCNCKTANRNEIKRQLRKIVEFRLDDMWDLFNINVDEIAKIVMEERNGYGN